MNVKQEKNNLVITIPMEDPRPSSSGKSLVVASTGGFFTSDVKVKGRNVLVALNAVIKP